MKQIIALITCCLCSLPLFAQRRIPPSDSIRITIEQQYAGSITLTTLARRSPDNLGNVVIRNHLGVVKDTAHAVQGVLLTELLKDINWQQPDPKLLSAYIITCVATDGYTVVFSWNELFNSPTGRNTYLVTTKEGFTLNNMPDRLALLCITDDNTGRRFVKGLQEIQINKIH